jgi:hypothetical protein
MYNESALNQNVSITGYNICLLDYCELKVLDKVFFIATMNAN